MDTILIMAALVLFIKMDVHHPATVKELDTLVLEIHTLGGNNAAFGMVTVVNANQRVNDAISFFMSKVKNFVKPCLLDFDCNDLPVSMNGPKFDSGCPGAVHKDGRPSSHYCKGNSYIFGYSHPWWKQCCKWNGGECQPKSN